MNKNTDPVFIEEIQRMDPCAAHTSPTLQPTRRPRRSTESSGHLDRLLYRGVSQGGVTLSLTSHPSLSFHLAYSCHLSRPPHHPFCLPLLVTPPLFVVWPRYQPDLWASTLKLVEKRRRYSREEGRGEERRGEEGRGGRREGRREEGRRGKGRFIPKQWKDYVPRKNSPQIAVPKQLSVKT